MPDVKLCYIAGPYTSEDYFQVEQNILNARKASKIAIDLGYFPVVPHTNTQRMDEVFPELGSSFWYKGTEEILSRCDAILMVDGWKKSIGSVSERNKALELGLDIFYCKNFEY